MSKICHEHCPGGAGGGLGVVVLVLIVIGAVIARPAVHAAETALHVIAIVMLIAIGSLAATALLAAVVYAAAALRRSRLERRAVLARAVIRLAAEQPAEAISAPRPLAIEARAVVSAAQGAEVAERTRDCAGM